MTAVTASVTITHPIGLHARPAVKLTKLAKSFAADIRWRRSVSRARFIATWVIQADGLTGMPLIDQTRSARSIASCATSSARARCCTPISRTSAPWRRPVSWRKKCSTSPEGVRAAGLSSGEPASFSAFIVHLSPIA